ncbi:MAG: NAD(P)-binding domain-containing protein [Acidobacteria bacterium]|nr:NAD(P)-binding domain-containing protein [Acidobacteriota bacterium]MDW7985313.1 NAD(P)-binding domain-containing protein [Acidobacteriota bacterium]
MAEPRVAVIGAGPSGLACAKHLLQVGLRNFAVYEKNADVGGNWLYSPTPGHSSVYASLCAITSKRMSAYEDFPMPDDYPEYPSHGLLLEYFRAYARRFGLYDFIRFRTEVRRLTPTDGDRWQVTLADGTSETFDYVLVASGHHWDPYVPAWEGSFEGGFLHSHDYKDPTPFRDQRVLVIGGGNSACDIAVDVSRVARFTAISMRRGYHVIPKFVFWGLPADVLYARMQFIPRPVRQRLIRLALWLLVGSPQRYGLLKPDHDVFQTHPIINSELLYYIRHGRIHPRRDVRRFEGHRVHFVDGTAEVYDVVIAATGYKIHFPFLTPEIVQTFWPPGRDEVRLYLNIFHPRYRNLSFIGLIQPNGCLWNLADLQARLVANYIVGRYCLPDRLDEAIEAAVRRHRRRYIPTLRHMLEVDWHEYRRLLRRHIPPSAPPWRDPFPQRDRGT